MTPTREGPARVSIHPSDTGSVNRFMFFQEISEAAKNYLASQS
jgi:hypothetical protein